MKEKVLLVILDGFGINDNLKGNAIKEAHTPFIDKIFSENPSCRLKTCGNDVGLPEGVMGNSEVGHLNIGGGRIVYQLNTLIDYKIETGEFYDNEALLSAIKHVQKNNSTLHLFGLLSSGGVHSSLNHLDALLKLFKRKNITKVYFHAFMDGRDTLPNSGLQFMKDYCQKTETFGFGKVASVSGRYYSMDRDNRWERVQRAYEALVYGKGAYAADPIKAIEDSYAHNITDEFILPTIITDHSIPISCNTNIENTQSASYSQISDTELVCNSKKPLATINDNDAVIFFNFRSDRPRELTKAFIFDDFKEFPTKEINNLKFITMTEYDINFHDLVEVAFRLDKLDNILGQVIEDNKKSQLRLAETEKYAHVTFFFNGGIEKPFKGEDRLLIPSPKIASYDLQPSMSAPIVTENAINVLTNKDYDFITINYANCDMVGHTGKFPAVVEAVETIDHCLSRVFPLAIEKGYNIILTADHGNAEQMLDEQGNVMTAHSMNEVPFLLVHLNEKDTNLHNGKLCDIAPTILDLMKIKKPIEMTGQSLISKNIK